MPTEQTELREKILPYLYGLGGQGKMKQAEMATDKIVQFFQVEQERIREAAYEQGYDTRSLEADYEQEDAIKASRISIRAEVLDEVEQSRPGARKHHDLDPVPWGNEQFVNGYNKAIREFKSILASLRESKPNAK